MFNDVLVQAQDLFARAESRTLLQFRRSPVFLSVLSAFVSEVQALSDAVTQAIEGRTPANASGEPLNAIGRIVGQGRGLLRYDDLVWFTPDTDSRGADVAPAWVTTAKRDGSYEANDTFFRQLIEAKISRNFMRFCSVPELKRFARQAFGLNIGFVTIDQMTLRVIVPDETSINIINLLQSYYDTAIAERSYFLPLAATVGISDVITLSEYNNLS